MLSIKMDLERDTLSHHLDKNFKGLIKVQRFSLEYRL